MSDEHQPHFYDRFADGTGWPPFQYLWQVGVVLSQLVSTILGGDPDETLSSRFGKAEQAGVWWATKIVCPLFDASMMEKDHCLKSIEPDEGRRELVSFISTGSSLLSLLLRTLGLKK